MDGHVRESLRPLARYIAVIDRCLRRLLARLLAGQVLSHLSEPVTLTTVERDGARFVVTLLPVLNLTAREKDITSRVGRGLGNEGIARELKISPNTVKHTLSHIYNKHDIPTRAALARHAVLLGNPKG